MNEVFYLPSFSFHTPFIFPVTNTQRGLRKNTLVLKTFLFFKGCGFGRGRCVCVILVNTFFLSLLSFFQREELLKPMGLKPDGTITPLEEALNQYSVIESSSDTD